MLSAPSAVQKPSPFTESGVIDQMVDDEAMRLANCNPVL